VSVSIAGVLGEFAASMLGIFVEMDVAKIHLRKGRCRAEPYWIFAPYIPDIAGRLWTKPGVFSGLGKVRSLLFNSRSLPGIAGFGRHPTRKRTQDKRHQKNRLFHGISKIFCEQTVRKIAANWRRCVD
jgi:hypothetical protein